MREERHEEAEAGAAFSGRLTMQAGKERGRGPQPRCRRRPGEARSGSGIGGGGAGRGCRMLAQGHGGLREELGGS